MIKNRSRLTLIKDLGMVDGYRRGLYICECGVEKVIIIRNVNRGDTISCGCFKKELAKQVVHGYHNHPLYSVWLAIIQRCTNKNNKSYPNYGGRGIGICKQWRNPKTFIEWCLNNGWIKGLDIDRENNNKGYYPSNCRFVTRLVNLNNTRSNVNITYNGVVKSIAQWCKFLGIKRTSLCMRLSLGWTMDECINIPIAPKEKITPKQVLEIFHSNKTQSELSKIYNISRATISAIKIGKNWPSITGKKYVKQSHSQHN